MTAIPPFLTLLFIKGGMLWDGLSTLLSLLFRTRKQFTQTVLWQLSRMWAYAHRSSLGFLLTLCTGSDFSARLLKDERGVRDSKDCSDVTGSREENLLCWSSFSPPGVGSVLNVTLLWQSSYFQFALDFRDQRWSRCTQTEFMHVCVYRALHCLWDSLHFTALRNNRFKCVCMCVCDKS